MRKHSNADRATPIVRVRLMALGIIALSILCAGPLLVVWKQAYIANTSMRIEAMTDTLSALSHRIAFLQMQHDRLAGNDRIESFARSVLQLDYPSSDRITVIAIGDAPSDPAARKSGSPVLAAVHDRIVGKESRE